MGTSEARKAHGFLHIGVTKRAVIGWIHAYGAADVIEGWTGTDEEAIAAIQADPREFFENCDNTDETGRCQGHPPREA